MTRPLIFILAIVALALGAIYLFNYFPRYDIHGQWTAKFEVDPGVKNKEQIEEIKISAVDQNLTYEMITSNVIDSSDDKDGVVTKSTGAVTKTTTLKGTYEVIADQLVVSFELPKMPTYVRFDPFAFDAFSVESEGKNLLKVYLSAYKEGDDFIVLSPDGYKIKFAKDKIGLNMYKFMHSPKSSYPAKDPNEVVQKAEAIKEAVHAEAVIPAMPVTTLSDFPVPSKTTARGLNPNDVSNPVQTPQAMKAVAEGPIVTEAPATEKK